MFRHLCLQKPPEKLPEGDAVQAETRMGRKVLGWRQESELRFRRDRNMEKWGGSLSRVGSERHSGDRVGKREAPRGVTHTKLSGLEISLF